MITGYFSNQWFEISTNFHKNTQTAKRVEIFDKQPHWPSILIRQ